MIRRSFVCKVREIILQLYKSLVRPHLEYYVQAWSPHLQKDIDLIEGVQRRATKMIPNLQNKSFEELLNILNITTSLSFDAKHVIVSFASYIVSMVFPTAYKQFNLVPIVHETGV